ncbi:hypothetical protein IF2G_10838 [Cordyceps javanica]|nr:hypothetical protein IF2G_10838 [Cordyceps javanica]
MKIGSTLFLGLPTSIRAWTYPDCEPDGCYRNLIDPRYSAEAPAFCLKWISGTVMDLSAIPPHFRDCPGVTALSSACFCVAYTATHTATQTDIAQVSSTTTTTAFGGTTCDSQTSAATATPTHNCPPECAAETACSCPVPGLSSLVSTTLGQSSTDEQTISTVYTTTTYTVIDCSREGL